MKLASLLMLLVTTTQGQQIPTQLYFPLTSQSENGSSATGHCTAATRLSAVYQCDDPTSSVVHDGIIPTLTGLDGNMWASQLLTINASGGVLVFDFTGTPNFQVRRVEMVVFNCPEWRISVQSVLLTDSALTPLGGANPTLSSCDSLVRVCIPNLSITSSQAVLRLEFTAREPTDWIHIAEMGFYANSGTCPPQVFIPEPTVPTTSALLTTDTPATGNENGETTANATPQAGPDATTTCMIQSPSCSTSTTLASVITAITTALLATLIFVLLQIALCKYHPKFTPGKPQSAASARGEELAVYEQVDGGEGGVAMSGPTYMEIGAGGENTIDLKKNEAYGTTKK